MDKGKSAMEQATKVMGTLAPLTAPAIWKNSFKDSDILARLKKASQSAASLAQQGATLEACQVKNEMEGLASQMEKRVNEISVLHDILGQVRGSKQVLSILKDADAVTKLTEALPLMDAECLSTMLMHIGNKLSEDRGCDCEKMCFAIEGSGR